MVFLGWWFSGSFWVGGLVVFYTRTKSFAYNFQKSSN